MAYTLNNFSNYFQLSMNVHTFVCIIKIIKEKKNLTINVYVSPDRASITYIYETVVTVVDQPFYERHLTCTINYPPLHLSIIRGKARSADDGKRSICGTNKMKWCWRGGRDKKSLLLTVIARPN